MPAEPVDPSLLSTLDSRDACKPSGTAVSPPGAGDTDREHGDHGVLLERTCKNMSHMSHALSILIRIEEANEPKHKYAPLPRR